ncbi:MAG: GNAT family N-acetyltransferase [Xanthobacteraceae bacterium]
MSLIRAATLADVDGIARVHVQAWGESYTGLVPPEAFEQHSMETRVAQWRVTLSDPDRSTLVYESDGAVAGFISGGPVKWTGLSTSSEVASLYLLDAVKRRGVGRALFVQYMTVLTGRGFTSCGLWTLSNNIAARRFYEAMGGRTGETRIDRRNDLDYEDISYLWDDVSRVPRP